MSDRDPSLSSYDLQVVYERCQDATENFFRGRSPDNRYCFELFRRALETSDHKALEYIHKIYIPLACHWTRVHPLFNKSGEEEMYFATAGFNKFYLTYRGEKFKGFNLLPQVLFCIKRCIHDAIKRHVERYAPPSGISVISFENVTETLREIESSVDDCWWLLIQLLRDRLDQLLAFCYYVRNLKPADITAMYPQYWSSADIAKGQLKRIRRQALRSRELRDCLGVDTEENTNGT